MRDDTVPYMVLPPYASNVDLHGHDISQSARLWKPPKNLWPPAVLELVKTNEAAKIYSFFG